jgi:hypothetical protein
MPLEARALRPRSALADARIVLAAVTVASLAGRLDKTHLYALAPTP